MASTDPRIDAYIAQAAPFAQPILGHLRKLVHQAEPQIAETIKWGMPFFECGGIVCHMAAFKSHCAFGLWRGGPTSKTGKEDDAMGHFGRITTLAELPKPLPTAEVRRLALQLARGLAAAHAQDVLHRDLKPHNVMLAKDGTVKLVDFGLARAEVDPTATASPSADAGLTRSGALVGTPRYLAPELWAGEPASRRADVYAPLSPGLRQLVLTYELPASVFPVSVPLERDVSVLEVLLEEPGATAEGGGLKSQGGVTVDGKTFTRYLGQSAPATAVVTLGVAKGIGGTSVPTWVLPLVLSLVTLGVILVVARRAPSRAPSRVPSPAHEASRPTAAAVAPSRSTERTPAPGTHESTAWAVAAVSGKGGQGETLPVEVVQLARHVAAVDALLARDPDQRAELRAELQGYRAARKAELVDALARRTRVR